MIKKLLIYLLPLCLLAYILAHFFFTPKTNSYSHSHSHSPEVQAAINPFIENKEIAGIVSILSDPDYNLTIDCFGYDNPPLDVAAACLEVASHIPFDQFLSQEAGESFFNTKKAWHTACDKAQGMEIPFEANN